MLTSAATGPPPPRHAPPRHAPPRHTPRRAIRGRRPFSHRLWQAGLAAALFILTLSIGNALLPAARSVTADDVGLDFLPFYTAGTFVHAGHADRLYDLGAVYAAEHATAAAENLSLAR